MGRNMKLVVLVVCVVAAVDLKNVNCHPTVQRVKRQSSSSSSASASASSSSGEYGLGASSGLGTFSADTKSNAFLPWGAFAAINLPSGGKLGAGCTGFSCGFQFGQYVAQFPTFGQNQNYDYNSGDGGFQDQQGLFFARSGGGGGFGSNNYNYNSFPQFPMNFGFPMFPSFQFPQFQQQSSFASPINFGPSSGSSSSASAGSYSSSSSPQISDFARLGSGHHGSSGQTYSYSNHNGIYSESGTRAEPNGRVTSYQAGTGSQPSIQTRVLAPGQSKNIYAGSAVYQQPDGSVSSYRSSGINSG